MLVEINGVLQEVTIKLSIDTVPTLIRSVEVSRDALNGPVFLDGPPKGWTLNGPVEYWDNYPEGPVSELKAPWYPKFSHDANSLNGENEGQIYVTPSVKARGITYNPFSIKLLDGKKWLGITARPGTATELPLMKEGGFQKTVLSGVLSSSLEQTYGYYEAEHICPIFKGSWFADWLMGPTWWPEFDMMEHLSTPHGTMKFYSAIHYFRNGGDFGNGDDVALLGPVTNRFKVSALWHPNFLCVYFNGQKLWEVVNPPVSATSDGLHEPAHRVINLAVGGPKSTWATPVDPSKLPATAYSRAIGQWKPPY